MNRIKIFIASSLDFIADRTELEVFFNRKNKELIKRNYFVELVIWEDFNNSVSETRLQDEYNQAIVNCDVFLMLFDDKIGKYTLEEFEIAHSYFLLKGKPKILTYHKRIPINVNDFDGEQKKELFSFKEKLKEMEHFTSIYKNIDDLKVQLYDYLEKENLIVSDYIENEDTFSFDFTKDKESLDSKYEKLTSEQFNVLKMLRHFKRVRISGCAGSGKTLIAIEKAIRLSEAGLSTIIICHNPFLSNYIKSFTKGKPIYVVSFEEWIYKLINKQLSNTYKWSKFSEPTKTELKSAIDNLKRDEITFDAVIVDEAQDFRNEWWEIIQIVLKDNDHGILYIFHDDNQALLPHRANYPIKETIIDLSKNCRNSGAIYEYLRANLHHSAPSPSKELIGTGRLKVFEYATVDLNSKIKLAIQWLGINTNCKNIVTLLAGDITFDNLNLKEFSIKYPIGTHWKSEIQLLFLKAITRVKKSRTKYTKKETLSLLESLTDNPLPTEEDKKIVFDLANSFYVSPKEHQKFNNNIKLRSKLYWKNKDGKIRLFSNRNDFSIATIEIISFFQNEDWDEGMYDFKDYEIGNSPYKLSENYIPVIQSSLFKGLESDSIILIVRNKSFDMDKELYVAISRAKNNLIILTDDTNKYLLTRNIDTSS